MRKRVYFLVRSRRRFVVAFCPQFGIRSKGGERAVKYCLLLGVKNL